MRCKRKLYSKYADIESKEIYSNILIKKLILSKTVLCPAVLPFDI